jgi:hypothetical protein
MSEETLRRFIERLNVDSTFRERVTTDPLSAFGEFDLSQTECVALAARDEDALRRLSGNDVSAFAAGAAQFGILLSALCFRGSALCYITWVPPPDECAFNQLKLR